MGAEFVRRMEDVLGLYAEGYDSQRPQVCFDEMPYQLIKEKRTPLPAEPGVPQSATTTSTKEPARATCSCSSSLTKDGATWRYNPQAHQRRFRLSDEGAGRRASPESGLYHGRERRRNLQIPPVILQSLLQLIRYRYTRALHAHQPYHHFHQMV